MTKHGLAKIDLKILDEKPEPPKESNIPDYISLEFD